MEKLKKEEEFAKNAPKEYKKEKKKLIKWTSIVFGILFVLISAYTLIGNIGSINIIRTLIVNLIITSLAAGVPSALIFVDINKKYKTRNIKDIEADKKEVKNKINSTNNKKTVLDSELIYYKVLKDGITNELLETNNEINRISEIRTSVIEEFCKDNLEIHSLLNSAYDKEFEKENKQKVKK